MNDPKETQDGLFVMKWRNFIPMMFAIVIGTNTVSIFYQKQNHNTQQIEYNKERSDRIAKRHLEDAKRFYEMQELRNELKKCQNQNK